MFALLVMGALYSTLAPSTKSAADTGTSQQVAQGKALFAVCCASCHGLNGEGQISGHIQGPPLIGVGAAAVEFQVATGRMPMAHPGRAGADQAEPVTPRRRSSPWRRTWPPSVPARPSPSRSSTTRPV